MFVFLRPPEADVTPVTPKMFSFEGWNSFSNQKERERVRVRLLKEFQHIFLPPSMTAVSLVVAKMFLLTCSPELARNPKKYLHFKNLKESLTTYYELCCPGNTEDDFIQLADSKHFEVPRKPGYTCGMFSKC